MRAETYTSQNVQMLSVDRCCCFLGPSPENHRPLFDWLLGESMIRKALSSILKTFPPRNAALSNEAQVKAHTESELGLSQ